MPDLSEQLNSRKKDLSEDKPQIIQKHEQIQQVNNLQTEVLKLKQELEHKDRMYLHELQKVRQKHEREIMLKNCHIKSMTKRINKLLMEPRSKNTV